jgi:plasmid stabilization system protein ParE
LEEFAEAAHYYENKQKGLGLRYIELVENAFVRIKSNPLLFRVIEMDVRKCRVPRFPYGVLFRERADRIEIVAVMHLHRDPKYWKGRI